MGVAAILEGVAARVGPGPVEQVKEAADAL
jgi:hypothetical protein